MQEKGTGKQKEREEKKEKENMKNSSTMPLRLEEDLY